MDLIYDKEANTWNVVANGESAELIKMNNNGTVWFIPAERWKNECNPGRSRYDGGSSSYYL